MPQSPLSFDLREEAKNAISLLGEQVYGSERKAANSRKYLGIFEEVYNRRDRAACPPNSRVVHLCKDSRQNLACVKSKMGMQARCVSADAQKWHPVAQRQAFYPTA